LGAVDRLNRKLLVAASATFLSMVVAFVLKTFTDAVFLDAYGVEYVPHFFVAQAAALITTSAAYGALIRRRHTAIADVVVLLSLVGACLFAPALVARGGPWVFVVTLVLAVLPALAAMAIWNAATAVVSGRAARAFIPRAGAAATLGAVLGGFGASAVVAAFGVPALAPVGGVLTAVAGGLVFALSTPRPEPAHRSRRAPRPQEKPALDRARKRLVWLLVAAAVVEALLAAFIDFGFKREVSAAYGREDMGIFFALFYGGANVLLLALQLVFASRLLASKSLRVSLSLEPAGLVVAALAWTLVPVLALAAATRGVEMILKFGLARPAQEVALSPLSTAERQRWKVLLRGVFSQGGSATGGLLLIAAAPLLAVDEAIATGIVAGLAFVWLVLQRRIARRYLDTLGSALGMLRLSRGEREPVRLDRDGLAQVIALLGSDDPELARFGREIVTHVVANASALAPHLGHQKAAIRGTLYSLLAEMPDRACLPALRAAIDREPADSPALARGLTALAAHGDPAAVRRARKIADAAPLARADSPQAAPAGGSAASGGPNDDLASAAWAYLAEVRALDDDETPHRDVLEQLLRSDGVRAARLYRAAIERERIAGDEADENIISAIVEGDGRARREGLKAAAVLGRSKPLVQLLKALDDNTAGADLALGHLDAPAMARLILLANARNAPPRLRARLIRALRSSSLPEARDVAARALRDEDAGVRKVATNTLLRHVREHQAYVPQKLVEAALSDELDRFAIYVRARAARGKADSSMVFRHDSSPRDADLFFLDELERRTERELGLLCAMLALLGNPKRVYAAQRALIAHKSRQRNQGVDLLQEVARGAHRQRLFELLEEYLQPRAEVSREARQAVCEIDPWLARCADRSLAALQHRLWALRSTLLFDHVDGEALESLAEAVAQVEFDAGEVVVEQGQPGDALYIVASGALTVEREEQPVAELSVGRSFGELALVDGRPRQATVRANRRSTLLRLPREPFSRALSVHPEIGLGLLRGLATWLRQSDRAPGRDAPR